MTKITVESGINIALVKYWGKRNVETNWPAVGSISLTLANLGTTTTVAFDDSLTADAFILNGSRIDDQQVLSVMQRIRALSGMHRFACIESQNRIPTASGLASSASGMSALCFAAWHAAGLPTDGLVRQSNFLDIVRRASGSAPRSLLGGIVELHQEDGRLEQLCTEDAWPISMVVARLTRDRKAVSSRSGMAHTQSTSPYYRPWVAHHPQDLAAARQAIARRDLEALGATMERSTMRMHASMLAADPPLRYLKAVTLAVLDAVEGLRGNGISAWYTMDAGPHVKILCQAEETADVVAELSQVVPRDDLLIARPGAGTHVIKS